MNPSPFSAVGMVDLSRSFDGDLQEELVLAMIGQLTRRARSAPEGMARSRAISASRIADITHTQRQTVCRKLLSLQRRGWIEQDGTLGWRLITRGTVSPAAEDRKALDARGIPRAVRLHAACSTILAGKPPPLP